MNEKDKAHREVIKTVFEYGNIEESIEKVKYLFAAKEIIAIQDDVKHLLFKLDVQD